MGCRVRAKGLKFRVLGFKHVKFGFEMFWASFTKLRLRRLLQTPNLESKAEGNYVLFKNNLD